MSQTDCGRHWKWCTLVHWLTGWPRATLFQTPPPCYCCCCCRLITAPNNSPSAHILMEHGSHGYAIPSSAETGNSENIAYWPTASYWIRRRAEAGVLSTSVITQRKWTTAASVSVDWLLDEILKLNKLFNLVIISEKRKPFLVGFRVIFIHVNHIRNC